MQVKNSFVFLFFSIGSILAGLVTSCGSRQNPSLKERISIKSIYSTPTEEDGYSMGVSACYAGIINDQLLMAGGCNFPEMSAAEGGKKCFYKGIYLGEQISDSMIRWRKVGELPKAAAYGVSITTPRSIVCIGGTNTEGAMSSVYQLSLSKDKKEIKIDSLPSLPCKIDNASGALLGNILYVAGGNADGKPSNRLFTLNLLKANQGWQELPEFPGNARIQPICVGQLSDGQPFLYMWGGFSPYHDSRPATLSIDGYAYSPSTQQWLPLSAPTDKDSVAVSFGGGVAVVVGDSLIMCIGGINKDIFLEALQREEKIQKATDENNLSLVDSLKAASKKYILQTSDYYRFNDRVYIYNTHTNYWRELCQSSATARAGAALIGKGNHFFCIHGELKPGIRTPQIVEIT